MSSEKEAVELVNDSDLGLTGGVYTKNSERYNPLFSSKLGHPHSTIDIGRNAFWHSITLALFIGTAAIE